MSQLPEPDTYEDLEQHLDEIDRVTTEQTIAARRQVQRFAAILCSCRRPGADPQNTAAPQHGCIVHGQIYFLNDGSYL